MKQKNALLCGTPLGFVQDQLWAGLARSLVWGSASLGSRPDSRLEILAGLARSTARLGSVRVLAGSVPDSTWLKTPLSARLGSTQIGLNSVQFGSVLKVLLGSIRSWAVFARSLARHGSRLG